MIPIIQALACIYVFYLSPISLNKMTKATPNNIRFAHVPLLAGSAAGMASCVVQRCGAAIGPDLVGNPDLLLIPHWGCMAAGWFWSAVNRTGKPLTDDIDAISRISNGGDNGLAERRALYAQALQVLS